MKQVFLTLCGLSALLSATTAFAADIPPSPTYAQNAPHEAMGGKPEQREKMGQEHFMKTDTNGDGSISKAEWAAQGEKMYTERDTNKDGKLTPDEMKAFHEAKRAGWKDKHEGMEKHESKPEPKPTEKK